MRSRDAAEIVADAHPELVAGARRYRATFRVAYGLLLALVGAAAVLAVTGRSETLITATAVAAGLCYLAHIPIVLGDSYQQRRAAAIVASSLTTMLRETDDPEGAERYIHSADVHQHIDDILERGRERGPSLWLPY